MNEFALTTYRILPIFAILLLNHPSMNLRILSSFLLMVAWAVSPLMARAESPSDIYADAVESDSGLVFASENATGEPDNAYAEFQEQHAFVTLDMGEDEMGSGNLTMNYLILQYGASYKVEFLNASMDLLQTSSSSFEMYSTEMTIAYEADPYRYVRITNMQDQPWKLDSIAASLFIETEQPVTDVQEPEVGNETDEQESDLPPQGLLIKLVDDGDPMTTVDAAVYVIGADGMRHAFPSETVYKTWFEDYDAVAYIDPTNLANYQLGANVTVRPGTWLVKITADPKVYAVEPGGILRWISSEEIAQSLYGDNWSDQIVDVPDVFWGNYTVGDPITTEKHPNGTIAILSTGEVVYLDTSKYYSLSGDVYSFMRFSTDFSTTLSDEKRDAYEDGGALTEDPNIAYPF